MLQLVDAFVQREQPTDAEQHDGNDECVDVPFPTEAERVLLGRLAPGPLTADKKQGLVARVGHRVNGLGQHRRGSGEGEGQKLGQRDA